MASEDGGPDPLRLGCVEGLVVLRDSLELPAYFLLPWLARASLQDGYQVVLVAAAYSSAKYRAALRKQGTPTAQAGAAASPGGAVQLVELPQPSAALQSEQGLLQALYSSMQAAVAAAAGTARGQPVALLIDSLQHLHALSTDEQQWLAFLHACRALGSQLQVPVRLVLLVHGDVPDDQQWVRYLEHLAQMVLALEPLEGRTGELDGRLVVCNRAAGLPSIPRHGLGTQDPTSSYQQPQHMRQQQAPSRSTTAATCSYVFRSSEAAGIKWLRSVSGRDLM